MTYPPNTYIPTREEAERDIHEHSPCSRAKPMPSMRKAEAMTKLSEAIALLETALNETTSDIKTNRPYITNPNLAMDANSRYILLDALAAYTQAIAINELITALHP